MVDRSQDLDFLGAERVAEDAWRLPVSAHLTTPGHFLYGGAAIAMAAAAMETVAERPLVWITTQYVSNAAPGETVDVSVELSKVGHRTTQAHVHGRADGRPVFTSLGALGEGRPDRLTGTWLEMPEVQAPEDCPEAPMPPFPFEGTFLEEMERRLAVGENLPPSTSGAFWTRIAEADSTSPPMLGWIADCIPMGFSAAMGQMVFGTSLDNTLRLAAPATAEWVLVDVRVVASQGGYGYGDVHLWAPDGALLGTGSQTAILRPPPRQPR